MLSVYSHEKPHCKGLANDAIGIHIGTQTPHAGGTDTRQFLQSMTVAKSGCHCWNCEASCIYKGSFSLAACHDCGFIKDQGAEQLTNAEPMACETASKLFSILWHSWSCINFTNASYYTAHFYVQCFFTLFSIFFFTSFFTNIHRSYQSAAK